MPTEGRDPAAGETPSESAPHAGVHAPGRAVRALERPHASRGTVRHTSERTASPVRGSGWEVPADGGPPRPTWLGTSRGTGRRLAPGLLPECCTSALFPEPEAVAPLRVVNREGRPVADAWVSVGNRTTLEYRHFRSDERGRVALPTDFPAGSADLQVLQSGFRPARYEVHVADLAGATLVLEDAAALHGIVLQPDGRVAARAEVALWVWNESEPRRASCDPEGRFAIPRPAPPRTGLHLLVRARDGGEWHELGFDPIAGDFVVVRLREAR